MGSQTIFCVEKQPLVEGGVSVTGIWETVAVFASEAGAQKCCEELRRAYGPQSVILRIAKRTVRP